MRRRPSPAFVLAFIALVFSVSGVGLAAIPARDGDVHICYSKKTGKVEFVDTQSDQFDCEKDWAGFVIDTRPTQLVSPNGKFRVEVTDTGARIAGPDAEVSVGSGTVSVDGQKGVKVRSGEDLDLVGGEDVTMTGGKDVDLRGGANFKVTGGKAVDVRGTDLGLTAAKRLAGTAATLALTGEDAVAVTSGKKLDLTGGTEAGLTAGTDASVTGGKKTTVRSGSDLALIGKNASLTAGEKLSLASGKDSAWTVGKELGITAEDAVRLKAKLVELTAFVNMNLTTKDYRLTASGKVDIKATKDVNIKGSKVKTNR